MVQVTCDITFILIKAYDEIVAKDPTANLKER